MVKLNKNELRIGSWFHWSTFASMGSGFDYIKTGADIDRYAEMKEPIVLTIKLIEQFGFEKLVPYDMWSNEKIGVSFDGNKWHLLDGDFEYVHQFQNTYLVSVGEEININEIK